MIQNWQGAPVYEKTPEEMARIKAVIEESSALQVMFGHLKGREIDSVVGAMFARDVEVGATVIEQGADGDYFYIVDSGTYHIFVKRQGTLPDAQPEWVQTAGPGSSFGELALMYNVARAATVQCAAAGRLWCLDRDCFQMMLVTTSSSHCQEYESFLSQLEFLSSLTRYEIANLADQLREDIFEDGEEIVTQGEEGDSVYFLYEGQCAAYMHGEHGEVEVMRYTTPGEYFGEVALVYSEPRRATVRASGECTVLVLKKEDVNLSVGDLRARLVANIETYKQYEAMLRSGAEP
jgi:cAMP-dependent protein kinase regulator